MLEHAARKSPRTKYHRAFAKNLLNRWPALWTFTHTDAVEPTNNHAERGLRGAVIYRKLSHGSQSEQGECTIERLLSAIDLQSKTRAGATGLEPATPA